MVTSERVRDTGTDGLLVEALTPLIAAAEVQDRPRVTMLLRDFIKHGPHVVPAEWLELTAACLEQGNFDPLSGPFRRVEFVGPDGHILVIGPYIQRRDGEASVVLSALLARKLPLESLPDVTKIVEEVQRAPLQQPLQPILPIRCLASTGNVGGESGEAFVVPDGWGWSDSARGPSMNNMDEQLRRFEVSGRRCIERIFDADSAALFLATMDASASGELVRHRSYDIHDVGHCTGLGLTRKTNEGLIPGYWYRCIEEWRSDGISLEIARRILDEHEAGRDLCSAFCTRFGVDVHRSSVDSDVDVACTMLILDRLIAIGALRIARGRLTLRDVSYPGLVRAFEGMRNECVDLTRRELQLERPTGIMRLYGSVPYHESSVAIIEGLVREPCRGFFAGLR